MLHTEVVDNTPAAFLPSKILELTCKVFSYGVETISPCISFISWCTEEDVNVFFKEFKEKKTINHSLMTRRENIGHNTNFISSMIKGVLGQPNFSPPNKHNTKNSNFLFFFSRQFKLVPFVQLNTAYIFVLTLTDDKLLKFVLIWGKSCVVFVWGEKLGWPRTPFIILLS